MHGLNNYKLVISLLHYFFLHICLDYALSVANQSKFFSFSIVRAAAMDMKVLSVCQNIYLGLNFTKVKPH